jgi:hypothetical protein
VLLSYQPKRADLIASACVHGVKPNNAATLLRTLLYLASDSGCFLEYATRLAGNSKNQQGHARNVGYWQHAGRVPGSAHPGRELAIRRGLARSAKRSWPRAGPPSSLARVVMSQPERERSATELDGAGISRCGRCAAEATIVLRESLCHAAYMDRD